MFDIGASELLVIIIVAIFAIGPKDMPLALRTAGRWIGKVRRVSTHFKSGIETMIREAEMEEMDKKWKAQNEAIMASHPGGGTADDSESDGPQMLPIKPGPESHQRQIEDAAAPASSPVLTSAESNGRKPAGDPERGTVPPPP